MGKFLKNFGLGLVYILVLPIFLATLAVAAVYGFFACLVLFFHATYRFFKGEDPFKKLDDDKKVDTIKIAQMNNEMRLQPAAPAQSIPAGPANVYVQQNYYQNNRASHQKEANSETAKPVEANGFYNDIPTLGGEPRKNQAIDVTPKETPSLTSNHSRPSMANKQPIGYIDIPKDDDGKDK
jgi:hypothetical protein